MGDFTVLRAATLTLRELLRTHITESSDPQLAATPIDLRSPREMYDANEATGVSLWLYQVRRSGDLVNQAPPRPALDQRARGSMPLELAYLVTPVTPDPATAQVLLGRVCGVFNDWAVITDLQDSLAGSGGKLTVHLDTEALADLTKLWHGMHLPYRLCVAYLVQYVTVDSDRPPTAAPVVTHRETGYVLAAT